MAYIGALVFRSASDDNARSCQIANRISLAIAMLASVFTVVDAVVAGSYIRWTLIHAGVDITLQ